MARKNVDTISRGMKSAKRKRKDTQGRRVIDRIEYERHGKNPEKKTRGLVENQMPSHASEPEKKMKQITMVPLESELEYPWTLRIVPSKCWLKNT